MLHNENLAIKQGKKSDLESASLALGSKLGGTFEVDQLGKSLLLWSNSYLTKDYDTFIQVQSSYLAKLTESSILVGLSDTFCHPTVQD